MIDVVFPKGNEKEFVEMASRLGYDSICFCYDIKEFKKKKKEDSKIKILYGVVCNGKDTAKARQLSDFVFVRSSEKNRGVFDHSKPDLVFGLEDSTRADFIYWRNSGLNQVFCKAAKKNDIIIGLSMDILLNSRNKARVLGRFMQNIKLCKKYKVKAVIGSFSSEPLMMRNGSDLRSLGTVLGMSTAQVKEMDSVVSNKMKENAEIRKSGVKGVKVVDL